MKTKGRTKNLPKWAQEEIALLERRLEEANETIAKQAGEGPTRIAVNESMWNEKGADYWAPDDAKITFWLPDPKPVEGARRQPRHRRSRYVTLYLDGEGLHINASHPIMVRPWASNVVDLFFPESGS